MKSRYWWSLARILILQIIVSGQLTDLAMAQWTLQSSGTTERLRAVSAVNNSVVWASGNKGTCVKTSDGGKTWLSVNPRGTDSLDFRDVEAFDETTAYLLSIGAGDRSRIYKTTNGGIDWTLQYLNGNSKAFFDAMAFWDVNNGIAVSDEVNGYLILVRTTDGGTKWGEIPRENIPPALSGEGAFAASGTSITVRGERNVWIGTGVKTARIYRSTDQGNSWTVATTPILSENESSGIFSVTFSDLRTGVAVGGDYRKESEARDNVATTTDGGKSWQLVRTLLPRGFRSCVTYVPGTSAPTLVAVGPSGTDYSLDNGASWVSIDSSGFHAVSFAGPKDAGWAVGEGGRIARYTGSVPDIGKSEHKVH